MAVQIQVTPDGRLVISVGHHPYEHSDGLDMLIMSILHGGRRHEQVIHDNVNSGGHHH